MGNLVLFDKRKREIWQSFDHPTDSLLPGQNLVSGQKLIASVSASNWSQGLLSFTILNGSLMAYIDTNPPQYYYASHYMNDTHLSFDGHTLSLVYFADQFLKLEHNGHLQEKSGTREAHGYGGQKNEDMQLHREAVTEMMSLATWCLQGDFAKRTSMSLVVKVLEGLVIIETNLNYNFTNLPEVGGDNQQREATISSKFPSVLSGPR
ncbi:hypothetical protein K7X08_005499 [Anisodus acutangulus]|uniref:Bulb-type lectin domain-containing protein n=1 Tax=Anisodus acutangulus TaxID=402998 RepID=A0A9Q1R7A5_9SOLA|nr:hypothetical protein K7X08_005499 [Anisodus acutangulus]